MNDYEIEKVRVYFSNYYLEAFKVPWENRHHLNIWNMETGRLKMYNDGLIASIIYFLLNKNLEYKKTR